MRDTACSATDTVAVVATFPDKCAMSKITREIAQERTGEWRSAGPETPTILALKPLYALELLGLWVDRGSLVKDSRKFSGGWWVQVDGEMSEEPKTLDQVFRLLAGGHSPILVVHEAKVEGDSVPWRELRYSPLWKSPAMAMGFTIGFWILLAFVGYALFMSAVPSSLRTPVGHVYWLGAVGAGVWRLWGAFRQRRQVETENLCPTDGDRDPWGSEQKQEVAADVLARESDPNGIKIGGVGPPPLALTRNLNRGFRGH